MPAVTEMSRYSLCRHVLLAMTMQILHTSHLEHSYQQPMVP
jgi:hypothetical protein